MLFFVDSVFVYVCLSSIWNVFVKYIWPSLGCILYLSCISDQLVRCIRGIQYLSCISDQLVRCIWCIQYLSCISDKLVRCIWCIQYIGLCGVHRRAAKGSDMALRASSVGNAFWFLRIYGFLSVLALSFLVLVDILA